MRVPGCACVDENMQGEKEREKYIKKQVCIKGQKWKKKEKDKKGREKKWRYKRENRERRNGRESERERERQVYMCG